MDPAPLSTLVEEDAPESELWTDPGGERGERPGEGRPARRRADPQSLDRDAEPVGEVRRRRLRDGEQRNLVVGEERLAGDETDRVGTALEVERVVEDREACHTPIEGFPYNNPAVSTFLSLVDETGSCSASSPVRGRSRRGTRARSTPLHSN